MIGARLHLGGRETTLIARGEHARRLQQHGLHFIAPDGEHRLPVPVVLHPEELHLDNDTIVLMCMKTQHMHTALSDLAMQPGAMQARVVCVQNGVANERMALRYFPHVYGTVVNLPAMFVTPGQVVTHAVSDGPEGGGGILDTGIFPEGIDDDARFIAETLSDVGFCARPDAQVMRWKYAKLLMNLLNVLEAMLTDFSASTDIQRRLREEALACFEAAGIRCATRDEVRRRGAGTYRMVPIAEYERVAGSSWQSMARGTGDIETEFLNGEICLLGRLHGVPTPANAACVEMAREMVQRGVGPGMFHTAQLRERIEALAAQVAE